MSKNEIGGHGCATVLPSGGNGSHYTSKPTKLNIDSVSLDYSMHICLRNLFYIQFLILDIVCTLQMLVIQII